MIKSKHIISSWFVLFAGVVTALFLSPYVVRKLGDVSYGIWILINSLTGYMGLLSVGMNPAINRYVARFHTTGERDKLNNFLSSARFIFSISGFITLLIGLTIAWYIKNLIGETELDLFDIRLAFILIVVQVVGAIMFTMYEGILVGIQRFETSNMILLVSLVVRSSMIFLLLYAGKGIVAVAVATLLSYAVEWGLMRHYSCRYIDTLSMSFKKIRKSMIKMALDFSIFVFIITIASRISFQTDSLVIGYYMSVEWITYFAIGANLVAYGRQLQWSLNGVIFPKANALYAVGDWEGMRELLIRGTRYSIMILMPLFLGFIILGNDFIKLWMGYKYARISGDILSILSIGNMVYLSQSISISMMISMGKHKSIAAITVSEALVNIAMSIILVQNLGVYGVAWGTTIPILVSPALISILVTRATHLDYVYYIKRTYLPIIPSSIVFSVVLLIIKNYLQISNWLYLICVGSFGMAMYCVALRYTYFEKYEVAYVGRVYTSIRGRCATFC